MAVTVEEKLEHVRAHAEKALDLNLRPHTAPVDAQLEQALFALGYLYDALRALVLEVRELQANQQGTD